MARPLKLGLDYFPFDVDFFDDEKIEAINVEFGIKGEIIAIRLLAAIYRNGYFIEWSEALKYKIAKNTNLKPELVNEVVKRLVKWGFFDKSVFDSVNILTSKGIQRRYLEATKRRNFKGIESYCLLNVNNNRVNVYNNPINVYNSTQSKVKESKVKESKVKERENTHARAREESDNSLEITELWIKTFGRRPKLPEHDATAELIGKFGYDHVLGLYREAVLKGFKNLNTLLCALDEKGKIKPKEVGNAHKSGSAKGATDAELADVIRNW